MKAEQPLENLIVIHPHLLQKFMRQGKNFANLLALYTFYTYQAKLQKTNQPLSTDEFTKNGMNWAMDRVKKTKKLLKKLELICVVQKGYYSYIKLPFIYTKKKVAELLGNGDTTQTPLEAVKPVAKKTIVDTKSKEKSEPVLLKEWLEYCRKSNIVFGKNNITYWSKQLKGRTTLEQKEALYQAISKKWKNFYLVPVKESVYHKFLGKSLMMDKDCDSLLDIDKKDGRFFYQFKNLKISSEIDPAKLFGRYGYDNKKVKSTPIISDVKKRILGVVRRF